MTQFKKMFSGSFPTQEFSYPTRKDDYFYVESVQANTSLPFDTMDQKILHYDADLADTAELTEFVHAFNHNVLGPQYELQADGSYVEVGARPAVDTFDGEKWLRSCGAVTNLFGGDASIARAVTLTAQAYTLQVFGAGSVACSYGTATVGNPLTFTATAGATTFNPAGATHWMLTATSYPVPYTPPGTTMPASNATTTNGMWFSLPDGSELWHALDGGPETDGVELMRESPGLDAGWTNNGDGSFTFTGPAEGNCNIYNLMSSPQVYGKYKVTYRVVNNTFQSNNLHIMLGTNRSQNGATSFTATMLSNTTNVINASSLRLLSGTITIDNISVQRIQGQPVTVAARVKYGLGSLDEINTSDRRILTAGGIAPLFHRVDVKWVCASSDGASWPGGITDWDRNDVAIIAVQVRSDVSAYRVGYFIAGKHTSMQWISWVSYRGTMLPSTLYRLMLGHNNPYPMWYNKISIWNEQVSDERILLSMGSNNGTITLGNIDQFLETGTGELVVVLHMESARADLPVDTMIYPLDNVFLGFKNTGTTGQFVVSDGVSSASVDFDWTADQEITVKIYADGAAYRIEVL